MATFFLILLGLAALYGVLAIGLYMTQPFFVYKRNPDRRSPLSVGLEDVHELELETPDGHKIIAWYGAASLGQPTILYFHGNSGNLAHRKERVRRFTSQGYGILMPSYRGYSGSNGKPSEAWNILDGFFAYDYLRNLGVQEDEIVLYGESLGTGIATPVAVGRGTAALILEAPFTSTVDIAEQRYPFFPVRRFMMDRYESVKIIQRVNAPILIVHGENDGIVPVELGKKLYEAAPEPKKLVVIEEAGHTRLMRLGAWTHIQQFIDDAVGSDSVLELERPVVTELQRSIG